MWIRRLVVATDFSPEARAAVQQGIDIGRRAGAELVLLHVCHTPAVNAEVPPAIRSTAETYTAMIEAGLEFARVQLEEVCEHCRAEGVSVRYELRDGFPDVAIPAVADELEADLVVMGTHGRTGIKRFLLGSVAERASRLCARSVLVARSEPELGSGFHRVLVGTDFSPSAQRALEIAVGLCAPGARIDLFHARHGRIAEADARATGAQLVDAFARDDCSLEFDCVDDSPTHAIQERLESDDFDMVAVGSHGHRGIRRFLHGSVAETTIRYSPCSVLVAHMGGGE